MHEQDGDEDWLALIPLTLLSGGDEPELWWMRWLPDKDGIGNAKRYTKGAPDGFEIWVGVHA